MLCTCVINHSLKGGGGEGEGERRRGRRRNQNSDDAGFKFPIPSASYCLQARGVCMIEASTEFNARAQGREKRGDREPKKPEAVEESIKMEGDSAPPLKE